MQISKFVLGLSVAIVAAMALPTFGTIITPNDDAYVDANDNSNPHDDLGLHVKGDFPDDPNQGRQMSYMEFDIPAEAATATSASLVLYQTSSEMASANIAIKSEVLTIDETTLTWSNKPENWGATFPDKVCNNWKPADGTTGSVSFDVLTWFQAQAGNTVTIRLRHQTNSVPPAIFEDREGSLTGDTANGPYIDWVPEPSSLMFMLSTGVLLIMRRRR